MKQLFTILFLLLCVSAIDAQVSLVKDINPGAEDANPSQFFTFGNRLLFRADSAEAGVELWVSDGTAAGTFMVQDINPGDTVSSGNSNPGNFIIYQDSVYFKARSNDFGDELFVTDGTTANTRLVKDIQEGDGNGNPFDFIEFNGLMYFTANDGINSSELWSSDGTTAGTQLVVDIRPGNAPGNPNFKTMLGDRLVFTANDGTNGNELWSSDGTAEGTLMILDIREGGNSSPSRYTVVGDLLYFRANDGTNGTELWVTDGTAEGTRMVKDINPNGNGSPDNLFAARGYLFFEADDGTNGDELWVSNGTDVGTYMLGDLNPNGDANPGNFIELVKDEAYAFTADDGVSGEELYTLFVTENIATGLDTEVELVTDLNPGSEGSEPEDLVFTGSALYFSAETPDFGRELYQFGVFDEVPTRISDVSAGPASSEIDEITRVGERLYFEATDATNGDELWTTSALTTVIDYSVGGNAVSPGDTIDFGTVTLGVDEQRVLDFAINNTGTGPGFLYRETAQELVDPFSGFFPDVGDFDSIPAAGSVNLQLGFFPLAAGTYVDSFVLQIPTVNGSAPATFYVSGLGFQPVSGIEVSGVNGQILEGDLIDFGDLFLSQDSTISVTLTNTGLAPLNVSSVDIADGTHFSVDLTGFGSVIAPGTIFTFPVTYAPTAEGTHETTLTFANDASDDGQFVVNLRGAATISSVNELGIGVSRAFPNPTRNFFQLELEETLSSAIYRIFDRSGRQVERGVWPAGADRHRFDLSGLTTGLYLLEVVSAEGRLVIEVVKR